jgi:RimJ/RimL family protein N-acetyltransferase
VSANAGNEVSPDGCFAAPIAEVFAFKALAFEAPASEVLRFRELAFRDHPGIEIKGTIMTLLARAQIDTPFTGHTAVIKTARLVLRAPRFEDARTFAVLAGDRRIAENTVYIPTPCSIGEARQWIADTVLQPAAYVITVGGEMIGACSLDGCDGIPELLLWIGVPFWGSGYATEAARGLIGRAFEDLGHKALTASARVSNPVSRGMLEKCGFRWTGVGLRRIRAIRSSVPVDRFLLDRS